MEKAAERQHSAKKAEKQQHVKRGASDVAGRSMMAASPVVSVAGSGGYGPPSRAPSLPLVDPGVAVSGPRSDQGAPAAPSVRSARLPSGSGGGQFAAAPSATVYGPSGSLAIRSGGAALLVVRRAGVWSRPRDGSLRSGESGSASSIAWCR
jgi:hypothetical protein